MHFSRMIQVGTVVAILAFRMAAMPAQAQDNLRIIDARGHQVGTLLSVQNIPPVPLMADIAMFETLDRMMIQDIAIMEATDLELNPRLVSTFLRAVPTVVHALPQQDTSWQRFEAVSIDGPSVSCTQTIMMASNDKSIPIVHVSSTGGKACSALVPSLAVGKPENPKPHSTTVTPAVDTLTAGSVKEHVRSIL